GRQDLLRHAGRGGAADVRPLRRRTGTVPGLVPQVPREPVPRAPAIPRGPDPHPLQDADALPLEERARPQAGARSGPPWRGAWGRFAPRDGGRTVAATRRWIPHLAFVLAVLLGLSGMGL